MLTSKFNLYKLEWLELVFNNRNKEYGAYYLRQHYAGNMVRAMGITFLGVALLIAAGIMLKTKPIAATAIHNDPIIVVSLSNIKPPAVPPKRIEQPKPVVPLKTTQLITMVVKPDVQITAPPPVITQIKGAIGPITTNGKDNVPNVLADNPISHGTAAQSALSDNLVHPVGDLDVMPEPVGGNAAWSKFLNKNLKFPAPAREEGVSGRVFLSFVVEKDGSLSNFFVERQAGHGFDEEAVRVLKLAKAWKPGIQNGQPVRVKYMIPIAFLLADSE